MQKFIIRNGVASDIGNIFSMKLGLVKTLSTIQYTVVGDGTAAGASVDIVVEFGEEL